jgi:hypothetical protein
LLRELPTMNARYAITLIEIKECDITNIEKKKRIILIVAEFHMKLGVYNYIQSFLLIEFPFNLEIIIFVLRIKYNSKRII